MSLSSFNLFVADAPRAGADVPAYIYFSAELVVWASRDLVKDVLEATDGKALPYLSHVLLEGKEEIGPLEWVPVSVLKPLVNHPRVREASINRCVWAYLSEMDDDDPIGLLWLY